MYIANTWATMTGTLVFMSKGGIAESGPTKTGYSTFNFLSYRDDFNI